MRHILDLSLKAERHEKKKKRLSRTTFYASVSDPRSKIDNTNAISGLSAVASASHTVAEVHLSISYRIMHKEKYNKFVNVLKFFDSLLYVFHKLINTDTHTRCQRKPRYIEWFRGVIPPVERVICPSTLEP